MSSSRDEKGNLQNLTASSTTSTTAFFTFFFEHRWLLGKTGIERPAVSFLSSLLDLRCVCVLLDGIESIEHVQPSLFDSLLLSTDHVEMTTTVEQLEPEMGRIAFADDAPPVLLDLMVVENKGLVIQNHPEMGRVLVATRDFDEAEIGSAILVEKPAIVCQQDDHMDFMEKFLDAPEAVQVGILDMFYQPLESPMGKSLIEPAKVLFMIGVLEDFMVIHQLLSIWMTNGMQWQNDKSALTLFASKFSHSCNPNLGFSTRGDCIEFILLRPIAKGELATFSYLTDLLETPTYERRQLLLDTKSFVCMCDRCLGPDYCRCIKCPGCPEEKIPCYYPYPEDKPFEPLWACPNCNLVDSAVMEQKERSMDRTLDVVSQGVQSINFQNRSKFSPSMLHELVQECQGTLSPVHYLTIKSLSLLFSVSTSLAFDYMKKLVVRGISLNDPSVHSLFRISVEAGFALVLAGECCAANCSGCYDDYFNGDSATTTTRSSLLVIHHEANYDRALPMRHALDNLLQLPISWWPPCALDMAERYLPLLKAKYGTTITERSNGEPEDDTIQELEAIVVELVENASCLECGTYWDGKIGQRAQ
eukprot:scaffold1356_cov123-Cylindrotheca_fusiformis.AAC.53